MKTELIPFNKPVADAIANGIKIGKELSELSANGKTTWKECIRKWKRDGMNNATIKACFKFTDDHIVAAMFRT